MNYKKRISNCKRFGALKFQDFVFRVEDLKWKSLKKICPNFIKYYDKYCDYKTRKRLKKIHSNVQKNQIKDENYLNKILMRKEFNKSQNRNYHIDMNTPFDFIEYLEWNKRIHVFGLKVNLINLPIIAVATTVFFPSVVLFGIDLASLFINFQCINIQNYNINRLKDYQWKLEHKTVKNQPYVTRKEQYQIKQKRKAIEYQKHYGEAANLIYDSIKQKDSIPSIDEIVANIENKEQLMQLKKAVSQALLNTDKSSISIKKIKK